MWIFTSSFSILKFIGSKCLFLCFTFSRPKELREGNKYFLFIFIYLVKFQIHIIMIQGDNNVI